MTNPFDHDWRNAGSVQPDDIDATDFEAIGRRIVSDWVNTVRLRFDDADLAALSDDDETPTP